MVTQTPSSFTNAAPPSTEAVIMELANVLRPLGIRFTIQEKFDIIVIDTGRMTLPPETCAALSDACPPGLGKIVVCLSDTDTYNWPRSGPN